MALCFTNPDIVDEASRNRVFNLYVVQYLTNEKNAAIWPEVKPGNNCFHFKYSFRTNKFEFVRLGSQAKLRDSYLKYECGLETFESVGHIFEVEEPAKMVFISVFNFSCRDDNWCPSLWAVPRDELLKESLKCMVGESPPTFKVNPWFSNDILKSMFRWENIVTKNIISQLDQKSAALYIESNEQSESYSKYVLPPNCVELYHSGLERALLPFDMIQLIKDEFVKDRRLIIIEVVNYMKSYFLLIHYALDDSGKVSLTFIPSPGDDSLKGGK